MEEFRVFKRKIYSKLLEWKQEENGRTAGGDDGDDLRANGRWMRDDG